MYLWQILRQRNQTWSGQDILTKWLSTCTFHKHSLSEIKILICLYIIEQLEYERLKLNTALWKLILNEE